MNDNLQWHYRRMLILAYKTAQLSNDPRTQNGAVIMEPYGEPIIARGWNDVPVDSMRNQKRMEAPLKALWVEHAERAAIYDAARRGVELNGMWMACCWSACTDCARAIVMSGIYRFIRHKLPMHRENTKWNDNIAVADEILREGGVEVVDYEGPMGDFRNPVTILFNGWSVNV